MAAVVRPTIDRLGSVSWFWMDDRNSGGPGLALIARAVGRFRGVLPFVRLVEPGHLAPPRVLGWF
jgi:hypothetical protein